MSLKVRYDYGFNTSRTQQHEVIEYVTRSVKGAGAGHANCRCITKNVEVEEGPYVVLYTEQRSTAECIAMLLNADGTTNNYPETPLMQAKQYMQQRFARNAVSSPPGPAKQTLEYDPDDYSMAPGDCPPGDLGNEVR